MRSILVRGLAVALGMAAAAAFAQVRPYRPEATPAQPPRYIAPAPTPSPTPEAAPSTPAPIAPAAYGVPTPGFAPPPAAAPVSYNIPAPPSASADPMLYIPSYGFAAPPIPATGVMTDGKLYPPDSQKYVGVVDTRFLSDAQLEERVNRMIALTEQRVRWKDVESRETMRLRLKTMILHEWAIANLLTVHALQEGLTATNEEIEQRLNDIYQASERDEEGNVVSTAQRAIQAIGISQAELREMVLNAILSEKLIRSRMEAQLDESHYRQVYEIQPQKFVTPLRARLNFMRMRFADADDLRERRRLQGIMETWREKAVKEAKRGKFLDVAREFHNPELGQHGGDYGWVTESSLPIDYTPSGQGVVIQARSTIVDEVFRLKPGEVSKVLTSQYGLYVFQMVELQQPTGLTYEEALPKVESVLFEEAKRATLNEIQPLHTVVINASGIDFESLNKSPEQLDAERDERRRENYMKHQQQRLAEMRARGELPSSGDPFDIAPDSLEILRRAQARRSAPTP